MEIVLNTAARRRKAFFGSFQANGAGAVTLPLGDGTAARTGVGVYTVTLDRAYPSVIFVTSEVDAGTGDQKIGTRTWSNSTGKTVLTFTVIDISAAAAADITGRINWSCTTSDAVSL